MGRFSFHKIGKNLILAKFFVLVSARTVSDGLLFPAAGKVAKRAGRNQWFLHFLARYALYGILDTYRTFAWNFFSLCYRIVSAAAQEESRCVGALRKHAGGMFLASDLGGYAAAASIWNYTAKLEPLRQLTQYSVGGFLNRRFKQRFGGAIRGLPVADTAR